MGPNIVKAVAQRQIRLIKKNMLWTSFNNADMNANAVLVLFNSPNSLPKNCIKYI